MLDPNYDKHDQASKAHPMYPAPLEERMESAQAELVDHYEEEQIKEAEVAEQVLARLTDKGIVCPDCGNVCQTVVVERFAHREFTLDYDKKQILVQNDKEWENDDWAYHCPHCDSLNIDEELREAKFDPEWKIERR